MEKERDAVIVAVKRWADSTPSFSTTSEVELLVALRALREAESKEEADSPTIEERLTALERRLTTLEDQPKSYKRGTIY